jgi:hypothetical protein
MKAGLAGGRRQLGTALVDDRPQRLDGPPLAGGLNPANPPRFRLVTILQELGHPRHDHVQRDVARQDHVRPRLGSGQRGGPISARQQRVREHLAALRQAVDEQDLGRRAVAARAHALPKASGSASAVW